jgi:GT2 family glycosyltransferase
MTRMAVLIVVAYRPGVQEVGRLRGCLAALDPVIGYAVVSNAHQEGSAVEALREGADAFLVNAHNPGYGRAVNQAVSLLRQRGRMPLYVGALNTDLAWRPGSLETLLAWMQEHGDVAIAVPQLVDPAGVPQKLCKRHPTLLSLFSRRFLTERCKFRWLKRYDRWFVMADQDYAQPFQVPYLSGCCMLIRGDAFLAVGGFDERFFLYLEDADLTRMLAREGRAMHAPVAVVEHHWGRGNHHSRRLTMVNIHSVWLYFNKWGWRLW